MAETVTIEGTSKGKELSGDVKTKVHEALKKTLEAELRGATVVPTTHHTSIHVSVRAD
jgi:hypothetical protein